jgi:hypothetical protein
MTKSKSSVPSTSVFSSIEFIDYEKLRKILLCSKSACAQALEVSPNMNSEKVFSDLYEIYKRTDPKTGKLSVDYNYSKKCQKHENTGRIYACGPSLQTLPKIFRNSIVPEGTIDIDMTNAHPTILLGEINNLHDVHQFHVLNEIVEDRDQALDDIASALMDCDRSYAKMTVIRVLNGGGKGLAGGCDMLEQLVTDAQMIADEFLREGITTPYIPMINDMSEDDDETKHIARSEFRALNAYLQDKENAILMMVMKLLNSHKITTFCPMFDGIYQMGRFNQDIFDKIIYPKMIKLFGYKVEFISKPMEILMNMDTLQFDTCSSGSLCLSVFSEQRIVMDLSDPYRFGDFLNELKGRVFNSFDEMKGFFVVNFQRCVLSIAGSGFYLKDLDSTTGVGEYVTSKDPFNKTSNMDLSYKKDDKICRINIHKMLQYTPSYNSANVFPGIEVMQHNDYNLWVPPVCQTVKSNEIDMSRLGYVLDVLKYGWADGDEELYKYILAWMRMLVCEPLKKTGTALFVGGKQGIGKGFITNFLIGYVLGQVNCVEYGGFAQLCGTYEFNYVGKRLLLINETSVKRNDFVTMFDNVKRFITDDRLLVNPKCINSYRANNFSMSIITTNHMDSLHLEYGNGDRRFTCIEGGDKYKNDTEFWEKADATVMNLEVAKMFYMYLKNLDKDSLPNPCVVMHTGAREKIMMMSMNSKQRFIREHLIDNISEKTPKTWEWLSTLYQNYVTYCNESREFAYTRDKFIVELKRMCGETCCDTRGSKGMKFTYPKEFEGKAMESFKYIIEISED